ncbi:PQQ-binding-like beta-propeller repeat protein [Mesoterricola sediminis]|uniref:Pyrrolo-quinoline quinone repeat domain-containing protein n=1 Tax=Mesoterricola sediminis TaxID=2927980 RepID=A0AA48HHA5_9BACT|nr:PQQ-binding-like beta-propeller repeat protein [Mesoterricola sediminis]BDU78213.1 hypothetical protein METESE_31710 [Mesoterricola sediminis]
MVRPLATLCLLSSLALAQEPGATAPKQAPPPVSVPAASGADTPSPARSAPPDYDFYNNNPVYPLELEVGRRPLWSKNLVEAGFKVYNPGFTRERILLCDHKRLAAMDPATGELTWDHTFERDLDDYISDGDLLVYTDHRMGLMGGDTWLHGFDMRTNTERWTIENTRGAWLHVFDGRIYQFFCSTFSSTLHCLGKDGKDIWTYKTRGASRIFFTEAFAIFTPGPGKKVIALNLADGTEAWTFPLESDAFERSVHKSVMYLTRRNVTPIVGVGGTVFVTAVDLKTGKQLWQYTTSADDGWFHEQIGGVISNGDICVLDTNRRLIGLNARTGERLWVANPTEKMKFLDSKPIILGGSLFVIQTVNGKKSILQFLDLATGAEISRTEIPDEAVPPAKVVGKSLFLCFRHGDMLAFALREPAAPTQAPAPASGR